jgi:apolipoprotein D and lipocalin family protein
VRCIRREVGRVEVGVSLTVRHFLPLLPLLGLLTGCVSGGRAPIPTVPGVDLPRFMGDWYVIAHIPTFIEKEAYDAVESYALAPDGTIATTFTFRAGGPDGPAKRYTPRGFVRDRENNSTWGMQFIWPIKAEFLIASLDAGYTQTIIARNARDYAWIMARTPEIPAEDYDRHVAQLEAWGYDLAQLRRVPHAPRP